MIRFVQISLIIICFSLSGFSQNLANKQLYSIKADSVSLESVLDKLTNEWSVNFYYSPSKIPLNKKINVRVNQVTLEVLINLICEQVQIGYKISDNQVILTPLNEIKREKLFTISGFVSDSATGERLIAANIYIPEIKKGSVSNAYGFYSFSLPEGKYTIKCTYIGYKESVSLLDLNTNKSLDFSLPYNLLSLKEISLFSDIKKQVNLIRPGQDEIPLSLMRKSPNLLGESDLMQYIKLLPGVQSNTDGPYGLYIRGSTPQQTSFILDDAQMFNMYHISGWFSTINPDIIKDVQVYKSHLPSNTGGSTSSVIDIRLRDGNNKNFAITGGIGTITSRLTLEGPIVKNKSSFIISARRSYFDQLLKLLSLREETGLENIYFYDLNAKLNYSINHSNRLYLSFYKGMDVIDESDGLSWGNMLASFRWNHVFSDKLFSNLTLTASNYKHIFSGTNTDYSKFWFRTLIRNYALKADFIYYLNPSIRINYGLNSNFKELVPFKADKNFKSPVNFYDSLKISRQIINTAFSELNYNINSKINVDVGLRLSLINNFIDTRTFHFFTTEPLVALQYKFTNNLHSKVAYSRNYQYHHGAKVFDFVIPFERFIFADEDFKPQYADHLSGGLFYKNSKNGIDIVLEGFYSKMHHLYRFLNTNNLIIGSGFRESAIEGTSKSYGIEYSLRKMYGRFSGMLNYTWTKIFINEKSINNGNSYSPYYHREHNLSVNSCFEVSKKLNLSATWVYMSGNPYNLPIAKYELNGRTVPLFSSESIYNHRMPGYHRLDVSVQFKFGGGKHYKHSLSLMLYNVYAKRNPILYSYRDIVDGNPDKPLSGTTQNERTFSMLGLYVFQFTPAFTYEFKFE